MLSIFIHGVSSLLVLFVANRLVVLLDPKRRDCEINIFTEKFKLKKGVDSVAYCFICWVSQYNLCIGFNEPCWYTVYFYQGFLIYRGFGFLEQYVPASIKPFPYVNLWSSSNIVLWVNIGRELGLQTNPLLFTAIVALYLYLQFMKTSME